MASRLWRNRSLAAAAMRLSPPVVQKKIIPFGQSIVAGPSSTAFRRMYSVHQPGYPHLKLEEEIDEVQSKKEKEPEEDMEKETDITKLYSTSQKILITCLEDFTFAYRVASKLGDASNIVVTSPKSCGEMKRLYENARYHMLELSKLGATVLFNVEFPVKNDIRINPKLYDRIILVTP